MPARKTQDGGLFECTNYSCVKTGPLPTQYYIDIPINDKMSSIINNLDTQISNTLQGLISHSKDLRTATGDWNVVQTIKAVNDQLEQANEQKKIIKAKNKEFNGKTNFKIILHINNDNITDMMIDSEEIKEINKFYIEKILIPYLEKEGKRFLRLNRYSLILFLLNKQLQNEGINIPVTITEKNGKYTITTKTTETTKNKYTITMQELKQTQSGGKKKRKPKSAEPKKPKSTKPKKSEPKKPKLVKPKKAKSNKI